MTRYSQDWLPNVFNDFFDNNYMPRVNATAPSINVAEDDKRYHVEVAAPGMTKDDFNIHLDQNGDLVINMEKKDKSEEKDKKYLRREFAYAKYEQTLVLPDDVDKTQINAEVKHGILHIELPKVSKEEAKVAHAIEVH